MSTNRELRSVSGRSPAPSGAQPRARLRKPFRLSRDTYAAGHCFSVTIVVGDRKPTFVQPGRADAALDCLRQSVARYSAEVYAYCLMPDHLHLLARTPAGIRFDEFIRHFKQLTGFRLPREGTAKWVWQPSYYDHAVRREEDLGEVADYIWSNPVRAGLVQEATEYPFSGSMGALDAPDAPEGAGLRSDATPLPRSSRKETHS